MTKQEMFNRAVRGLRSQGWEQAYSNERGSCVYETEDGKRCAYGWIDPSLGRETIGSVQTLCYRKIGLAAELDRIAILFAEELQMAHDTSKNSEHMRTKFVMLAEIHGLTWPSG